MNLKGSVLRVSSDIYPSVSGGIGLHAIELSKVLTTRGWKHVILTIDNLPRPSLTDNYKIVAEKLFIKFRGNKLAPLLFMRMIRILDKIKPDIIHAHSHLFYSSNVVALLRKIYHHYPLIITCHGIWSQSISVSVQKFYMKTLGLFTLNSADEVLCYTELEKELLKSLGVYSSKIEVIPNGIDVETFVPSKSKKRKNNILWIGRFVPGKRPDLAIIIMSRIKQEFPDITLTMIGDGPLKNKCVQLIRDLGVERNVKMIKFIPYKLMPKVYQMSDLLLITSSYEGVPRVMLEAMSCEIPVVIPRIPHLISIVNGNGAIFEKDDISDAVDQVRNLLSNDELRHKLGGRGRLKIMKEYSWKKYVMRIEDLYRKFL